MPRPRRTCVGEIPDTVSISERPASVEDRAVPGHWEGDLLCGSANSYIVTLVERQTRYVMLAKIPSRDTETVVKALIKQAKKLPEELYKSLTWDRGNELADHKRFTMATDIAVYFCDPQSPWQRGSNENTNRLLRQYFPRGTDLSVHSQARLNQVARQLNERPRKTLGYAIAGRTISSLCCVDQLNRQSRAAGGRMWISGDFDRRWLIREGGVTLHSEVEPRHGAGALFLALHDGKGISETSHRYLRAMQKSHVEGVRIGFSFARK